MRGCLFRGATVIAALSLVAPTASPAQTADPADQSGQLEPGAQSGQTDQSAQTGQPGQTEASAFSAEQLDALLAPIALYPDALLVQVLMASTFPLQVVEASRWLNDLGHDTLQGDALAQALSRLPWDPSVKSLAPFPQIVAMLNTDLDWMQQLGYAFATQQTDVMSSIQRLRHLAQANGTLKSTAQQRVLEENDTIGIEPTDDQLVHVPVYNPTVVYGVWPYPVYQPVYIPPPFGYVPDSAFVGGLAFATGVVVVGSLFGFARPRWRRREVHVNVDRFNAINMHRTAIQSEVWRPPAAAVVGRPAAPPPGPVGFGPRPMPVPATAFRPTVQVPSYSMDRTMQPGFHPVYPANRTMQPGFHPTYPVNRTAQPIARPPAVIQRPAAAQRGGPPPR
jgi:hypothetical protein